MLLQQTIHDFGLLRRRRNFRKSGIGDGLLSMMQLNIVPGLNPGMQPVSSTNGGSNLGSKRLYILFAVNSFSCSSAALLSPSWLGLGSSDPKASRKARAFTYILTCCSASVPQICSRQVSKSASQRILRGFSQPSRGHGNH